MISHFGLDIGSQNIKLIQVAKDKESFKLMTAGMIAAPGSGLISDSDKDLVAIAEAIKKLRKEAQVGPTEVVASIPERSVFTQLIEVPKMKNEELEQAIPWEAENLIPHPLSEVNLDWQVVETTQGVEGSKMKVLLVAAPSTLVEKCLKVVKLADLVPLAVETESLAILRCLKPVIKTGNALVVNFGAQSLEISVVGRGELFLARTLPSAGVALTRAIGSALNLELPVAEEYKKSYGLTAHLEGKVAAALEPVMNIFVNEIKKAIRYFEEKEKEQIKLMVLAGGSSLLPGLTEFFTRALGIEIQIFDPFSMVKVDSKQKGWRALSPYFTVAMGLAMRE
jgi:type IV pilus assembly protein PilM